MTGIPSIPPKEARREFLRFMTRLALLCALAGALAFTGYWSWQYYRLYWLVDWFQRGAEQPTQDSPPLCWYNFDFWEYCPDLFRRGLSWPVDGFLGTGEGAHRGFVEYAYCSNPRYLDEGWVEERVRVGEIGTRAGASMLARAGCWAREEPLVATEWIRRLDGDVVDQVLACYALPLITGHFLDESMRHAIDVVEDDRDGSGLAKVFGLDREALVEEWKRVWLESGDLESLRRESLRSLAVRYRDAARDGTLESLLCEGQCRVRLQPFHLDTGFYRVERALCFPMWQEVDQLWEQHLETINQWCMRELTDEQFAAQVPAVLAVHELEQWRSSEEPTPAEAQRANATHSAKVLLEYLNGDATLEWSVEELAQQHSVRSTMK